jgi:hypothetical protein
VNPKGLDSRCQIRKTYVNASIEPTRADERLIKRVIPIRRCQNYHVVCARHSIQFHQQLIQSLHVLLRGRPASARPTKAYGVELVNKEDARSVCASLSEKIPDTLRPLANEDLDELGRRAKEEGHIRLPRHCASEQRLSCATRPFQQDTLRRLSAERVKGVWIVQELNYFLQFLLGGFQSSYIGEGLPVGGGI